MNIEAFKEKDSNDHYCDGLTPDQVRERDDAYRWMLAQLEQTMSLLSICPTGTEQAAFVLRQIYGLQDRWHHSLISSSTKHAEPV